MNTNPDSNMAIRDYLREIVKNPVKAFREITKWSENDYKKYNELLKVLRRVNRANSKASTTEKGKALENIVNFIIEKTFILTVFRNCRIPTNEVDQFIVVNDYGRQAMHQFNFTTELMGFDNGYFLGECKDYGNSVSSTWVGKFYSLLKVCGNCHLGIIFSYNGLSGEEDKWYDAHGLTKVIYRMEPDNNKTHILDFNKNDFNSIAKRKGTFFDIITVKKRALQLGAKSEKLYEEHGNEKTIKCALDDFYELNQ